MPHKRTGRITDTAVMNPQATPPEIYLTGLYLRISGEEAAKGEKLNNQIWKELHRNRKLP